MLVTVCGYCVRFIRVNEANDGRSRSAYRQA